MLDFDAREAKQEFGRLLDEARRAPVAIRKHGRKVAVVMAAEEFSRLEELYDLYWAQEAEKAGKEGFIGPEKSAALLGLKYDARRSQSPRGKRVSQPARQNSAANKLNNRAAGRARKKLSRSKTS